MSTEQTCIHLLRGADTIGGSCIKIIRGSDSIILDYGMPLMEAGGAELDKNAVKQPALENGILLDVAADGNKPLAFIISHAHPDHYGLIDYVEADTPVFISEACQTLLSVGNIFLPENLHAKRLQSCQTFVPGKAFSIGPFTVTAFMMDHSAFGACSLLVEVNGKRIFYTGDFRMHGRNQRVNDYLLKKIQQPDVMLMEGTTLDDGHPVTFPDEQSVEDALVAAMQKPVPMFVSGSGSNIDRIVSLYRAAKRSGRILVLDLYQMYLLEQLKPFAPGLPPHEDDHLRVFYPRNQSNIMAEKLGVEFLYRYSKRQIKRDAIDYSATNHVFRLSNFELKRLCEQFVAQKNAPQLVYSMWLGYKNKQPDFAAIEQMAGTQWQYIHTSGHAYTDDLKKLAAAIKPKKLVPVHTVNAADFPKHFDKVWPLANNETLLLED